MNPSVPLCLEQLSFSSAMGNGTPSPALQSCTRVHFSSHAPVDWTEESTAAESKPVRTDAMSGFLKFKRRRSVLRRRDNTSAAAAADDDASLQMEKRQRLEMLASTSFEASFAVAAAREALHIPERRLESALRSMIVPLPHPPPRTIDDCRAIMAAHVAVQQEVIDAKDVYTEAEEIVNRLGLAARAAQEAWWSQTNSAISPLSGAEQPDQEARQAIAHRQSSKALQSATSAHSPMAPPASPTRLLDETMKEWRHAALQVARCEHVARAHLRTIAQRAASAVEQEIAAVEPSITSSCDDADSEQLDDAPDMELQPLLDEPKLDDDQDDAEDAQMNEWDEELQLKLDDDENDPPPEQKPSVLRAPNMIVMWEEEILDDEIPPLQAPLAAPIAQSEWKFTLMESAPLSSLLLLYDPSSNPSAASANLLQPTVHGSPSLYLDDDDICLRG
jgi:hypothetical protein